MTHEHDSHSCPHSGKRLRGECKRDPVREFHVHGLGQSDGQTYLDSGPIVYFFPGGQPIPMGIVQRGTCTTADDRDANVEVQFVTGA
jgi:hypothetical protein